MVNPALVWTAFFAPLAACVLITLFFLKNKNLSSLTAIAGIGISFICTLLTAFSVFGSHGAVSHQEALPWMMMDGLTVTFGFLVNPLAIMMLLVVTGVGSAIFIYSRGYMAEDASMPRFFAFLSLFAFSMIGIVLSNNLIQLFIFWELVGVSSYLLIGFWYHKPSAANASVKAFMANRVADFGFLCGILLLWSLSGVNGPRSFQLTDLAAVVASIDPHLLTIAALLLFCGVVGKSAQVPLHVWLADAMEGPTPVSALIHAATMVAAGVYLLARVFFVFEPLTAALTVIAWIGGITALMAATIAVVENDIKRILAYSTLSQLGLMVMALGLAGPMPGMYHLTTHAFFKALLFLGAGSVIYALHHEQNIWKMHGLLKQMPVTGWTFLLGTLALCGIFPLSGFFSKDEILALAFEHNKALYALASIASFLTSFYMGRLFFVAFLGKADSKHPAHESPAVMTLPLVFLCALSVIGGFIGIPHFLYPSLEHPHLNMTVAVVSSVLALAGLGLAFMLYGQRPSTDPLDKKLGAFGTLLRHKYYFDEIYTWYVDNVQQSFARLLAKIEEILVVRIGVHGLTDLAHESGKALRQLQTGVVQFYALVFVLGAVCIFLLLVKL